MRAPVFICACRNPTEIEGCYHRVYLLSTVVKTSLTCTYGSHEGSLLERGGSAGQIPAPAQAASQMYGIPRPAILTTAQSKMPRVAATLPRMGGASSETLNLR